MKSSRTLRRPMFRMGGSAQGITSGLDKPKRGLVDEPGGYAGKMEFLPTGQEMETGREHYPQYKRPEGEGLSRFLTFRYFCEAIHGMDREKKAYPGLQLTRLMTFCVWFHSNSVLS